MQPPIRVVLADDSYLVREALAHVLDDADGIEVVASCADRDSLLAAIAQRAPGRRGDRHPDAAVGRRRGAAGRRRCCASTHPEIGVVVLSQFAEPRYGLALLEHGSDGRAYLLKERIQYRGQLVSAI